MMSFQTMRKLLRYKTGDVVMIQEHWAGSMKPELITIYSTAKEYLSTRRDYTNEFEKDLVDMANSGILGEFVDRMNGSIRIRIFCFNDYDNVDSDVRMWRIIP